MFPSSSVKIIVPETCVSRKLEPPSHTDPGGENVNSPEIVTLFSSENPLA